MERLDLTLSGIPVTVFGPSAARDLVLQPVGGHDRDTLAAEAEALSGLCRGRNVRLACFEVPDWNQCLSPWAAPAVYGDEGFGGGAADTLSFVTDILLPALPECAGRRVILAGYSLAGLFALWACTVTDRFDGAAAVSPSLWFPGWADYETAHPVTAGAVYLSLGDREEKTKNPVMSTVGDAVRAQHARLAARGVPCTLEWNPGGHFRDPEARTARGIAWAVGHTSGQ